MNEIGRRAFAGGGAAALAWALAGCNTVPPQADVKAALPAKPARAAATAGAETAALEANTFQALYGAVPSEPFPITAVRPGLVASQFWRRDVDYASNEPVGTIIVDPRNHHLYHIRAPGRARRYGVGVGRQGFAWSGVAAINSKQEWPDWYPPPEMIERQPDLKRQVKQLQSGLGVAGGPHNPLGARAMYLWQNGKDTLFRIHGTLEPRLDRP